MARGRGDLLPLVSDLLADLQEAHDSELNDRHAGDAKRNGPSPSTCSYCRTIRRALRALRAHGYDHEQHWPKGGA